MIQGFQRRVVNVEMAKTMRRFEISSCPWIVVSYVTHYLHNTDFT